MRSASPGSSRSRPRRRPARRPPERPSPSASKSSRHIEHGSAPGAVAQLEPHPRPPGLERGHLAEHLHAREAAKLLAQRRRIATDRPWAGQRRAGDAGRSFSHVASHLQGMGRCGANSPPMSCLARRPEAGYARHTVWPDPESRDLVPPHAYELFEDSRAVGRLEWRSHPRAAAGWYVTLPPRPPDRLNVDPAIDQLARDIKLVRQRLGAERRALGDPLHRDGDRRRGPPSAPARRAPAPPLQPTLVRPLRDPRDGHRADRARPCGTRAAADAASDVRILAGELHEDALTMALRRIALLGGRVVAVLRGEPDSEP